MADSFKIGLLGHGTVGAAFAELIERRAAGIEEFVGRRPEISGVLTTGRGDFADILERSDIVVELIGGTEPATDYALRAMAAGKHVVTANKQMLAERGEELYAAAREHGVELRFEAAVGGVVPVVRVISETLSVTHIERVSGIVNGTTNYILSEMARTGAAYDEALRDAQSLGYAEADPTADVSGADAAAKMAVLARLAYGTVVKLGDVPYEGIEDITSDDIEYAKELGLEIKLIGSAERVDGGVAVRVYPAFLYSDHPLASVNGSFNAVTIESPSITEITLSGPGAGGSATATAVLGDVCSAMAYRAPMILPEDLPLIADVESAFYLHLEVEDQPGVLAQVAELLGLQGVSIKSVVQRGLGAQARLVMVVHPVLESKFRAAVELIGRLDYLRAQPRVIRVIEEHFEEAGA